MILLSPPSSPLTPISSQEDEAEQDAVLSPVDAIPILEELDSEPIIPDSEGEEPVLDLIQQESPRVPPLETDDDEDAHRVKRPRMSLEQDELEGIERGSTNVGPERRPRGEDAPRSASSGSRTLLPASSPTHDALPLGESPLRGEEEHEGALGEEGMTVSQDMAAFIAGMDPSELDMLPSSEPAQLSSPHQRFSRSALLSHLNPSPRRGKNRPSAGNAGDDSGFFPGPEDDVESLGSEVELAIEEEDIFPAIDGDMRSDEGSEGAFEGDDMWETFDETLAPDFGDLAVPGGKSGGVDGGISGNAIGEHFVGEGEDEDDYDEFYDAGDKDPPPPNWTLEMPTFKLGSGKPILLNEASLSKWRALLNDDDAAVSNPPDEGGSLPPPSVISFANASRIFSPIPPPPVTSDSTPQVASVPALRPHPVAFTRPSLLPPNAPHSGGSLTTGGFTDGRGARIALSANALARAKKLLTSSPPADLGPSSTRAGPLPSTSRPDIVPFSRPTIVFPNEGNSIPPSNLMDRDVFSGRTSPDPTKRSTFKLPAAADLNDDHDFDSPMGARTSKIPKTGLGSTALRGPFVSMENDRLMASHPSSPTRTSSVGGPSSDPSSYPHQHDASSPQPRPIPSSSRAPSIPSSSAAAPPRPPAATSTPFKVPAFRPPMKNSGGTPLSAIRSMSRHTELKSTPLKTSSTQKRVNIGMTPGGRPSKKSHKFTTPFKNGVVPSGLTPAGIVSVGKKPVSTAVDVKGKGKEVIPSTPGQESVLFEPVFDLTPKSPRVGLREYVVRPQTHSFEYLESIGVPEEVIAMDSVSAVSFVFDCGRSEGEALKSLRAAGGALATEPWVKNHWSLVVWKLASLVRSRPDLLGQYWSWEAAVKQLKYRYEREINHAERSAVKRIQEQDSSAGLSMVLCVSQIRWGEDSALDVEQANAETPLVIIGLELTDGWYRIRVNVDATLKSACDRGKIVTGSKLVICGARLESSREGTEVLEALSSSTLLISGNSTSLAPWDAKLGFTSERHFASLKSLTPTGGVASLLDVIVERVFPSGYLDLAKGGNLGTWNEEEEHVRADEWERGREKALAKLADELERTDGEWDEIIEILRERAIGVGPAASSADAPPTQSDGSEPDEILDQIEAASNKDAIVNRLSANQVHECLRLAVENGHRAKADAISELEKDLATSFPPREVRGFRVLRVRDAQVPFHGFASSRTALLTVWDASSLGEGFFVQGHRYLVSNVIPKGSWKRSSQEITLATRRDTRWQLKE